MTNLTTKTLTDRAEIVFTTDGREVGIISDHLSGGFIAGWLIRDYRSGWFVSKEAALAWIAKHDAEDRGE